MGMTKICPKCGIPKELETEYYPRPEAKNGYRGECKECTKARTNKDRDPKKSRKYRIRYKFGIEEEEYDRILSSGCFGCGSLDKLTLDHCHATGTHRGALCRECNLCLGVARDDSELLRRLADYLESPPLTRGAV